MCSNELLIHDLEGVFTGEGFVAKKGRWPSFCDSGFIPAPVHILCDGDSGTILKISRSFSDNVFGSRTIDGAGFFASAGWVDSHTHTLHAGTRGEEHFKRWAGCSYAQITRNGGGIHRTVRQTSLSSSNRLRLILSERLRNMLKFGTTTVEVKSGYGQNSDEEIRLLRIIGSVRSNSNHPEVIPTFLALHAVPNGTNESDYSRSMADLLPLIRGENLAVFVDVFPEKGFFSLATAAKFVMHAIRYGLKPKIHSDEITDMGATETFLQMGATSVDHLLQVNPAAIKLLASSETIATLLPATSAYLKLPFANARRLIDEGVRVAIATDFNPGTAPLPDLQTSQLYAASELRMTASEILCASTYNAAGALGLSDTHGALTEGRIANILLWRVDFEDQPLDGERLLQEIFSRRLMPNKVISRGRLVFEQ